MISAYMYKCDGKCFFEKQRKIINYFKKLQYWRFLEAARVSGLRPKMYMCVYLRVCVIVCVLNGAHFGCHIQPCIFLVCRSPLFVSSWGVFTPPAQNPFPVCVHHRSRSSHRPELRGWASLLQYKSQIDWLIDWLMVRLLRITGQNWSRLNSPGLRVCVYPRPTRQELLTLAWQKNQKMTF